MAIPRLKTTITYVIGEMEDRDREELFRLKRFKQIKSSAPKKEEHVCTCCRAMFAADERIAETVCPLCKKPDKNKREPPELQLNIVPCKSKDNVKENRKRLEHLMSHIDDVIDLTKQYKMQGIISPSIEKFIKSCNQVKEKIEDYTNAQSCCDLCRKPMGGMGKISASKMECSKPIDTTCSNDRPTEEPPCEDSTYNLTPETDDKLGHFEKKFKEIVKVTRLQNEDGTISEEKQVITIKTERRNPRKPKNVDKIESSEIINNLGGEGGCGEDGKGMNRSTLYPGPKQAKSESACRSQQMSEPKLRLCISAYNPKPTSNKDVSANFEEGSSIATSKITLPTEGYSCCKQKLSDKISKTTSLESFCPKISVSIYGGELSQTYLQSLQKPMSNVSVQAYCKEIKVKPPMEDKATCCLPICTRDDVCPPVEENTNENIKNTATGALWRDTWTSTSDLNTTPSKVVNQRTNPAVSFYSKGQNKDSEQNEFKTDDSCCTIKIIMKPPKVCSFEEKLAKTKQEEKASTGNECFLNESMLEALKRIILPSTESETAPINELEIKNVCKNCISKLSSAVPSQKSSVATDKRCQIIEPPVIEKSPSCSCSGTIEMSSSFDVASNKSTSVGSDTELCNTCGKSSTPSIHSQKHVCCLAKMLSDESFVSTCCDLVEPKSQKSVCCAKSKFSSAPCFMKESSTSKKSSTKNVCMKDAATSTSDVVAPKSQESVCCPKRESGSAPCFMRESIISNKSSAKTVCSNDAGTSTRDFVEPKSQESVCCPKRESGSAPCFMRENIISNKSSAKTVCSNDAGTSTRDFVEPKSQETVCCAKSKSSSGSCFMKESTASENSSAKNVCSKDAATSTKRSAKFDVRPVTRNYTRGKKSSKDCTCRSDPYIHQNRVHFKDPRKCQSFYENNYHYFRW